MSIPAANIRLVAKPGDIFLFYGSSSLYDRLLKWALGSPFTHTFLYWTETKRGLPLIIESVGKGVVIHPLYLYRGRHLRLMRVNPERYPLSSSNIPSPFTTGIGNAAAEAAEHIADRPDSYYDYAGIFRFVLPRLLWQKLVGGRPPRERYRQNRHYLCSELVAHAYENAGYPLLPKDVVPLPGDFASSPFLEVIWDGVGS